MSALVRKLLPLFLALATINLYAQKGYVPIRPPGFTLSASGEIQNVSNTAKAPGFANPVVFRPREHVLLTPTTVSSTGTNIRQPAVLDDNGIEYHGGPVMWSPYTGNPLRIIAILYGGWDVNRASLVLSFLNSLNGSSYFNTNTTYWDNNGHTVSNNVQLIEYYNDWYSQSIYNVDPLSVLIYNLGEGNVTTIDDGIYVVFFSEDVIPPTGTCTQFCGYHSHFNWGPLDLKFGWSANPQRCMSSCAAQPVGPSGDGPADAMMNIIAHELDETSTDPDLNAWYHLTLAGENGDLCAWNFGPTYTTANGAQANTVIGGANVLIQRNWVNSGGGFCSISF